MAIKRKSAKNKGRRIQNWTRDKIKEYHGIEPDVAVGGENGKDVSHERLKYSIECKNTERFSLWQAWSQAKDNCDEGDTPIVVVTRNRADKLAITNAEWVLKRLEIDIYD